ncbi:LysR family transcriptional regulator [Streptomyces sp. NPDC002306]
MLHLRYFVAVAEELNFSAAARRLHMAASPLSQRVRDLERELGLRLFDRDTHRVALTPAGSALLPIARDLLDRFNAVPWRLHEATVAQTCSVLMGIPPLLHPDLRSRVITLTDCVQERFELQRWPGSTMALATGVREGKLALALARLPLSDMGLEQVVVMSELMGAAVPADRFAERDSVALADLKKLAYVAPAKEIRPPFFDVIDHSLAEHGIRDRIDLSDTGFSGISEVISCGMAFSITMLAPESPMRRYYEENVLVLPIADFQPELKTALIWRRDRAHGDLKDLVALAREVFEAHLHR